MKQFKSIAKTFTRSDGQFKVYGFSGDDELISAVMCKDGDVWKVTEIVIGGKVVLG